MELKPEDKNKLGEIGQKYNLRFIILHGSYAKGTPRPGSDLDIAVLGKRRIAFDELLEIHDELADIFGDNQGRELDVKSLHNSDLLLKYYVTRDGMLLFGKETDFNEFKAYARRVFEDAKKLFELEEYLLKKQNQMLLEHA